MLFDKRYTFSKEKLSGIYIIYSKSRFNFYIGHSKDIKQRVSKHKSELRYKTHHCKRLQNAYTKYGPNDFELKIIQFCNPNLLRKLEDEYIAVFSGRDYFYNSKLVDSKTNSNEYVKKTFKKLYSRKKSLNEKQKISKSRKALLYVFKKEPTFSQTVLDIKFKFLNNEIPDFLSLKEEEKQNMILDFKKMYSTYISHVTNNPELTVLRIKQKHNLKQWLLDQNLFYDKRSDSWLRKSDKDKKEALDILDKYRDINNFNNKGKIQ